VRVWLTTFCVTLLFPLSLLLPLCQVVQWPKERPDDKLDGDDPEHIRWLYEKVCPSHYQQCAWVENAF
jgi:hypothetical protein